jgi:hypothetical protein
VKVPLFSPPANTAQLFILNPNLLNSLRFND